MSNNSISSFGVHTATRYTDVHSPDKLPLQLPRRTRRRNVHECLASPPQNQAVRRKESPSGAEYAVTRECSRSFGGGSHYPVAQQVPISVRINRAITEARFGHPDEDVVVGRYGYELHIQYLDFPCRRYQAITKTRSDAQYDRGE